MLPGQPSLALKFASGMSVVVTCRTSGQGSLGRGLPEGPGNFAPTSVAGPGRRPFSDLHRRRLSKSAWSSHPGNPGTVRRGGTGCGSLLCLAGGPLER